MEVRRQLELRVKQSQHKVLELEMRLGLRERRDPRQLWQQSVLRVVRQAVAMRALGLQNASAQGMGDVRNRLSLEAEQV